MSDGFGPWREAFVRISRLGLGALFVYAALSKLEDPGLFAVSVASYRLLPPLLVSWVALVLPPLELLAGLALVVTPFSREAGLVILGMMLVFLVGLVQARIRGLEISCGCFGQESPEPSASLGGVIMRDVLLLIPASAVACGRNGWIFGRFAARTAAVFALVFALAGCSDSDRAADAAAGTNAVSAADAAADAAAGTNAVPERWTENFPSALAQARARHRPLILFVEQSGCTYCVRMLKAFASETAERWIRGSGVYLARADLSATNDSPAQAEAVRFLKRMPADGGAAGHLPYVGVYWPKTASTNDDLRIYFSGRRGRLYSKVAFKTIAEEFVACMNERLKPYLSGIAGRTIEKPVAAKVRRIRAAAEGPGLVSMRPENGEIVAEGDHVTLWAKPQRGMKALGWRGPDGKPVGGSWERRKLRVTDTMPEGVYTAVFGVGVE